MSRYKPYLAYRDSGVEWISEVPDHWNVKRLRHVSTFTNSGIDKKSYEGQEQVGLCNYTDVYYNDFISADMPFMRATASKDEIAQFTLKKGDLIITKDSEDPSDIGIPALVVEDAPGVVCGYHLTLIRSAELATARFLHRVLQSTPTRAYFFIESPGITRYGLGQDVIGDLRVCMPPINEIHKIAECIDQETARIDALIAKKARFIELLKDKRQALIAHAVTKGLDPDVKMRNSGVEWLGDVPEHWDVAILKRFVVFQRGHDLPVDVRVEGKVPVVSSAGYSGTHNVAIAKSPGIVTGRYGSLGEFTFVQEDYWPLNTALYTIDLYNNEPRFIWYLLQNISDLFLLHSAKAAVPGIDRNDIHEIYVAAPMPHEQKQISNYLDFQLDRINKVLIKTQRSIALLKERRSAFITAAVTGQIDLREPA
ncbi:restriction endonuclease subunit S [Actimicrobium sp. CCI2.3]|uniref:restriction endonuclease subunit S n=1 Tax=Actimicrobium sp. CCI2.3 TaxID=3048616 RepID=UPI002AB3408C|nr:restriction endonuclease subunit S [Actimicrobium sp. CCI2.3]MDY7576536.1 restriction endonuclease subunit S [Actimicrobium sp. CCI2.3]MEB0023810.1 restriction endonuclease subunit S [Actimicrobium sp. CCI2.3]